MNKDCKHWNIFNKLSDWNIVNLRTSKNSKDDNIDMVFIFILKGVDPRMNDNILSMTNETIKINNKDTDGYM